MLWEQRPWQRGCVDAKWEAAALLGRVEGCRSSAAPRAEPWTWGAHLVAGVDGGQQHHGAGGGPVQLPVGGGQDVGTEEPVGSKQEPERPTAVGWEGGSSPPGGFLPVPEVADEIRVQHPKLPRLQVLPEELLGAVGR